MSEAAGCASLYNDELWDHSHVTPRELERLSTLEQLLPKEVTSVLDVGCGDGRFGRYLLEQRQVQLVSLDVVSAAARLAPGYRIAGSATALPFRDEAVDALVCSEVLEHLPLVDRGRALDEFARLTRRWLVLAVPFREHLSARRITCPECGTTYNKDWHLHSFDARTLGELDARFVAQRIELVGARSPLERLKNRARNTVSGRSPDSPCPFCHTEPVPSRLGKLRTCALEALDGLIHLEWHKPAWIAVLYEKVCR